MPRYKEHLVVAALTSGIVRTVMELQQNPRIKVGELIIKSVSSAVVGGIGGVLPDLIEPAVDPNHRGAGHSVVAGGMLASAHRRIWANPDIDPWFKQIVTDLAVGYGTHLVLDAGTPRGLPLLMRNL